MARVNLRVLMIEDSADDALLIRRFLDKGGYNLFFIEVVSEKDLYDALSTESWDIVLSDYNLPGFDAMRALDIVKEFELDLPFIVVSGKIGEMRAVEMMKNGANDYVMKENLARLTPVVSREINDAQERQKRRSAESDLELSEKKLRALITSAPNAIIIADSITGSIMEVNDMAVKLTEYAKSELLGMILSDLDPLNKPPKYIRISIENPAEVVIAKTAILTQSRQNVPVEISATTVEVTDLQLTQIILRDIRAQEKYEEGLIQSRNKAQEIARLQSAFLANMSHEIRTPLTSILGFASVLAEEVSGEHLGMIELIEGSGNRLLETLNSVLELARLQAGKKEVALTPVDIHQHIQESTALFGKIASDKGIDLRIVEDGSQPFAMLDVGAFHRILSNIINNALKFTDNGFIEIRIYSDQQWVTIEIEDSGRGISEEFLPNMFKEFRQESTGFARTHEGSGLGLSIVNRLLQLMQGFISVTSTVNSGSCFKLGFPLVPHNAQITSPTVKTALILPESNIKPKILVVEDNVETCEMIKYMLAKYYDADIARTVDEAKSRLTNYKYHLFLFDINLSDKEDGIAILKYARNLPQHLEVPALAMTAFALDGDREYLLNEGFDEYISKPFVRRDLLNLIANWYLNPTTLA